MDPDQLASSGVYKIFKSNVQSVVTVYYVIRYDLNEWLKNNQTVLANVILQLVE